MIALTVGDVNADGVLDVVTLDARGSIRRMSANREGWDEQPLATWPDWSGDAARRERLDCFSPISTTTARSIWWRPARAARASGSADERNEFRPLPAALDAEIFSVVDLDDDGQLDLVGLSDGRAVRLLGAARRAITGR